jgi:hypothetical protein
MIYKDSFWDKELNVSRSPKQNGTKKIGSYGLFIGLLAFAVHFVLQTVYKSVLTDVLPEVMLPSYFSVAYTYSIVSLFFFLIYFIVNYKF